ncbi:MAG: thiamine phosphate synthase [Desulfotomaculum sp.]|nr:thiamine phosphate synthase [Desulfotomaculum sp.]
MLNTDIYAITAEQYSLGRTNIEVVQELVAAGVKIIQYREKEKKKLYKFQECQEIRAITRAAGVTFIVNDDLDVALAVKADGVHIGQEDLPAEQVRRLVGKEMIIGLSTHSPEQARAAVKQGVDYIGVGPVFATNTKKDVCAPVGLGYLEYVAKHIDIPFVVIGGIKEHHILELHQKGATCFAMITEIVESQDIAKKIKSIRGKLLDNRYSG